MEWYHSEEALEIASLLRQWEADKKRTSNTLIVESKQEQKTMKSLQECKDEVARKYGRKSFYSLLCLTLEPSKINEIVDQVAELYASQFKDQSPLLEIIGDSRPFVYNARVDDDEDREERDELLTRIDSLLSKYKSDGKQEIEKEEPVIDFAVWYSGMDRDKVLRAYERYERETGKLKKQE